ncbi:MAG: calcium/sodium antiporter [Lachnospiraceae bacterium]|nr:calcium/sodium antiporter [Lachnospiraceae bacterium]
MIAAVIYFAIGLVLLIKGGDWFVDGATGIAKRFHVPDLLIGATVVSIGTTLPEVMVSATSAVQGASAIAYGNAIGSVICNTALIAALTVAIRPTDVPKKTLITPVIFFFSAAAFYAGIAYITGYFNRITGAILLGIFVAYMILLIRQAIAQMKEQKEEVQTFRNEATGAEIQAMPGAMIPEHAKAKEEEPGTKALLKEIFLIVIGAALIAIGANLLVNNGTIIAEGLGVPQSVIAVTFVALGTSLPELVTAIVSLAKGHGALSLGNVIGANLFNLVLVSGMAMTLKPFRIPVEKTVAGMNASLAVDIPVMLAVMIILTIPTLIRGKLSRIQGFLLLLIYAAYCVFQFA